MKIIASIYPALMVFSIFSGAFSSDRNKQSIPAYTMRMNCRSVVSIHAYKTENGKTEENVGTGFIGSSHGFIVTGLSMISNSDSVFITFYDGERERAWKSFFDEYRKIAILYTNRKDIKPVVYSDYAGLPKSRTAFIMGNSLGIFPSLSMFNINRFPRFKNMFIIEGIIPPGNSGSPVFDEDGKLIGMVLGTMYNSENNSIPMKKMGFAVYSDIIETIIINFVEYMEQNRCWAGISIKNILDNDMTNYVMVIDTAPGGPVEKAGIAIGDTIIEFEGNRVTDTNHLATMVKKAKKGKVVFTLKKGDMKITRIVRMEKLPWKTEKKQK